MTNESIKKITDKIGLKTFVDIMVELTKIGMSSEDAFKMIETASENWKTTLDIANWCGKNIDF